MFNADEPPWYVTSEWGVKLPNSTSVHELMCERITVVEQYC